jgi:molybdenum transport protein
VQESDIERLILEDVPYGDLTTHVLGTGSRPGRVTFEARTPLVLSGVNAARRIFERSGATVATATPSGAFLFPGALILEAEGPASALFAGWKVAQTLIEWASGVATAVHDIVVAARAGNPAINVACTRKTVPFTRALSAEAILAGGGTMHRLGLSETILVFPEHRTFFDASADPLTALARLRTTAPERSIVVEVLTEDEARCAAPFVDVLQLEKFSPASVARVVASVPKREDGRPVIAVAGGISASNAAEYANTGADLIVTSSPYYARPAEVQVRFNASDLV